LSQLAWSRQLTMARDRRKLIGRLRCLLGATSCCRSHVRNRRSCVPGLVLTDWPLLRADVPITEVEGRFSVPVLGEIVSGGVGDGRNVRRRFEAASIYRWATFSCVRCSKLEVRRFNLPRELSEKRRTSAAFSP